MPELPDLEAIRDFLNQRLPGTRIEAVQPLIPFIVRLPEQEFVATLEGNVFEETARAGKFLLFHLAGGHRLVVNAMLTGRYQYCLPSERRRAKTCFVFLLANGHELRYVDERLMGKVYLVKAGELDSVPQFAEMGPDALSPQLTEDIFSERLRRHSGQIKNILTNQRFIAGIGNAYSDEILFVARIHPYRKRPSLSDEEVSSLYRSLRSVLEWAIPQIEERIGDKLPLEEVRDFLRVHRRGGEPCPVCGGRITDITAGNRVTSFCRTCQN
ncbi:MAG: DNA-formamidopyrimidine glycosylase family protein [Dehalococcoidia bacterium]|jgi:formamidopyrimidine-DNA glycosylase